MKKSRRTYNGVHLNKKSNTQDVVEQSLTSKVTEGNMLVPNHMIKMSCFRSDRGSDTGKHPVSLL